MKTGFLTFEQFHGKENIGSSRIRCDYLIKHWEEVEPNMGTAERFQYGAEYDVVIYQKAYFYKHAEAFGGIKILDLCDPDWLHWGYHLVDTMQHVHGITCSSLEIAKMIASMTYKPVAVIPDRIDNPQDEPQKKHKGKIKTVVWFGYADNFPMLDSAMPAIAKRGLDLIVISAKTYTPSKQFRNIELKNLPWSPDTWKQDILKGDIVLNPKFTKGKYKFKSDNKTTQAWALGMPVAHIDKDLDLFAGEKERIEEATKRRAEVLKDFNVVKSVHELKEFIYEIIQGRDRSSINK